MKAEDTLVTNLLQGAKQFIVPIFQRDYSWGTKHCQQLWNDIIRVGSDPKVKGHFIGSVVYIAAEDNTATITRWLLIDGQQRFRFCSPQCHTDAKTAKVRQSNAKRPRVAHNQVACQQCGSTFTPKRADTRFCSPRCRLQAHRKARQTPAPSTTI
jgi:hypothetical protein